MGLDLKKITRAMRKDFNTVEIAENIQDPTDFVSTGNKAFDLILDGGIPFGFVTEFMGFSQSGKSLFISQVIANAQRQHDAVAILIDRENAYTNKRGLQLGIDNSKLIIAKPADVPTPFHAFSFLIQTIEKIRAQDPDIHIACAIDSISAFGKDVDLDKSDTGRKAKSIHEGLREVLTLIDRKVLLAVANQYTYKIGVLYGDPRTTTAGESMKYYSNVRLALEDRKMMKDPKRNDEVIGNWIGAEVIKTRLGPCHRACYLQHLYDSGIDYHSGYARLLADRGYLRPKNKKEFYGFKQTTVVWEDENDKDNKREYHELSGARIIQDHPELEFDKYPPYKGYENESE